MTNRERSSRGGEKEEEGGYIRRRASEGVTANGMACLMRIGETTDDVGKRGTARHGGPIDVPPSSLDSKTIATHHYGAKKLSRERHASRDLRRGMLNIRDRRMRHNKQEVCREHLELLSMRVHLNRTRRCNRERIMTVAVASNDYPCVFSMWVLRRPYDNTVYGRESRVTTIGESGGGGFVRFD
ncbi:hypothetical protein B296_00010837 [Ensete ventricosum]|uniref:Uncharacterized protein n=1 Tax=Ensete ventricosum TaxID=4639 RepID=A0A427ATX4_ENSVE|nr:hypothetical protein B296_00010837 [Ensete ventricosum]